MTAQVLYSVQLWEDFDDEPVDKEEVALIAAIGERLKWARQELCKFTIKAAAALLDIEPDYLNEIEKGFNVDAVPLKLIKKASEVYQVSIDYLFCLHDDWEIAPEVRAGRDIASFLLENRIDLFSRLASRQLTQKLRQDIVAGVVNEMLTAIFEAARALDRFIEVNPVFVDMPASSPLFSRLKNAQEKAMTARIKLIRCKAIPKPENPLEF